MGKFSSTGPQDMPTKYHANSLRNLGALGFEDYFSGGTIDIHMRTEL